MSQASSESEEPLPKKGDVWKDRRDGYMVVIDFHDHNDVVFHLKDPGHGNTRIMLSCASFLRMFVYCSE